MSAPTQSSPMYKRRLINAMLEEPASRRPGLSSISLGPWSTKLVAAVAGLALVSALGVFLFLFHRDASASPSASPLLLQAEPNRDAGPVAGDDVPSSEARISADQNVPAAAALQFSLKRSRAFQNVGPIGIRLLRVNLRRRTCDVTMRLNNHRIVQRRLLLNRPLEVRHEASAEPLRILVSSIAKDSIAGVVASSSADSSPAKRLD